MNEPQQLQLLAEQSWPVFERKLRRYTKWQKIKKSVLFGGVLSLVILAGLQLGNEGEQTKKKPESQKAKPLENPKMSPIGSTQKNTRTPDGLLAATPLLEPLQMYAIGTDSLLPMMHDLQLTNTQEKTLRKKADLLMAFVTLNINANSWSLQDNKHSLAAIIGKETLLILNLMYGNDSLPAYPNLSKDECFYRPSFFANDCFIHLAQYDVSEWITTPIQARVIRNRITPPQYLSQRARRSNAVSIPGTAHQYMTTSDRENPGTFYYRNFDKTKPFGASYPRSSANYFQIFYNADRQTKFNALLHHYNDTLLVISDQATRLTRLTMYGSVIDSKEIVLKSEGLKSLKRKELLIDPIRNDCYVIAPTNFHFVFFKIDLTTGIAQQVYQTKSVWDAATFEVIDGVLNYEYKSKTIHVQLYH
ncbi:MAG: hypothetical protein ACKOWW_08515 [Flavobacteriales bacterium]